MTLVGTFMYCFLWYSCCMLLYSDGWCWRCKVLHIALTGWEDAGTVVLETTFEKLVATAENTMMWLLKMHCLTSFPQELQRDA